MLTEKLKSEEKPQVPAVTAPPVPVQPQQPTIDQDELLSKLGALIDSKVSSLAVPTVTTKRTVTIEEEVRTPIAQQAPLEYADTGDDVLDDFVMNIMK